MDNVYVYVVKNLRNIYIYFLGPIIVFIIFATTVLLFLPDSFYSSMDLLELRSKYSPIVHLVFLLGLISVVPYLGYLILRIIQKKASRKQVSKKMQNGFKYLSQPEKAILREFKIFPRNVIKVDQNDPAVVSLMNSGIITHADNIVTQTYIYSVCNVSITDEVREYMEKCKIDIGFPNNRTVTIEEATLIGLSRPSWVKYI